MVRDLVLHFNVGSYNLCCVHCLFLSLVVTFDIIFLKDVDNLMKAADHLPRIFASGSLWRLLLDAVTWLRQASEVVSTRSDSKRCNLSDAEEVLASSQVLICSIFLAF